MSSPHDELCRLTATEAVLRLKRQEVTPLDLIDAAARRIAEVEPAINALPTLCIDRARAHAERLMRGEGREAEAEPGWLCGLPVAIKDLADVAGVRTTYGSPIFRNHVPTRSHPVVKRIERRGGIVIAKSNTAEFEAGGSTFNDVFGRKGYAPRQAEGMHWRTYERWRRVHYVADKRSTIGMIGFVKRQGPSSHPTGRRPYRPKPTE